MNPSSLVNDLTPQQAASHLTQRLAIGRANRIKMAGFEGTKTPAPPAAPAAANPPAAVPAAPKPAGGAAPETLANFSGKIRARWDSLTPEQRLMVGGLGLGGAVGLGSGLLSKKEKKKPLRSALTGALSGGAIGLGLGLYNRTKADSSAANNYISALDERINMLQNMSTTPSLSEKLNDAGKAVRNEFTTSNLASRTAPGLAWGALASGTSANVLARDTGSMGYLQKGLEAQRREGAESFIKRIFGSEITAAPDVKAKIDKLTSLYNRQINSLQNSQFVQNMPPADQAKFIADKQKQLKAKLDDAIQLAIDEAAKTKTLGLERYIDELRTNPQAASEALASLKQTPTGSPQAIAEAMENRRIIESLLEGGAAAAAGTGDTIPAMRKSLLGMSEDALRRTGRDLRKFVGLKPPADTPVHFFERAIPSKTYSSRARVAGKLALPLALLYGGAPLIRKVTNPQIGPLGISERL